MASNRPDVIIIGAGIIGAACAAALCQRGAQVLVLEAGVIAGGATAAGMGHLVVMDDNPAELALSQWSCQLWREWADNTAAAHEYTACGTLWVAQDEEELAAAHSKQATLSAHGITSHLLDDKTLYQTETQLAPGLAGGLLVPADALVYPPKSTALLLQQAANTGRMRLQAAQVVNISAGSVSLADGSQLQAGLVLVANGMGAAALLPELPLRAKKGHIAITDRYPGFLRHHLVELGYIKSAHASDGDSVAFNIQARPTGQMMIGSSRQYDQNNAQLDPQILRKMLARACQFLPNLPQLNLIRCWTGVRCASPDGLPLLGPHPSQARIWLACGHEGLGVTTALASAELIADLYAGAASKIALEPYLAKRFPHLQQAA